jgi:hypothetical protein
MTDMATAPRSSTPRSDLERLAFPRLTPHQVDVLRSVGEEQRVDAGHVFFDVGQEGLDFI